MQAFKKFVFQELIFSVILGLVAFVLFQTVLKEHYLPVFWILFAILTVFTAIFHYSIVQAGNKELSNFSSFEIILKI
ncbi:MAG: hypothetical protein PF485_03460 [Bacteroidales bacterium]|jgi:multisubunit Na+/H+ antiporter MnhE subunit|nr:hypothetical protein [Bacteroidales bacterium]